MSQFAAADRADVETLRVGDPHAEAARLAAERGGDVATDAVAAERAVRARVEAGRRAIGADDVADDDLLRRADEIRTAAAKPAPLTTAEVDQLRQLAEDVARAARIKQRTEARFAETLQAKVAASSGVALHPSAVLAAAKAVTDAEAAVLKAEQNIADLGPEPEPFDPDAAGEPTAASPLDDSLDRVGPPRAINPDGPVLTRTDDVFDEVSLERKRSRTRAASLFGLFGGVGLVCLGLGVSPPIAVALIIVGVLLGLYELQRGQRVTTELAADKADVGSSLANMDALWTGTKPEGDAEAEAEAEAADAGAERDPAVAEPEPEVEPEPAPAPVGGVDHRHTAWVERRFDLDASKENAEERLRVARQRWHQLAGPDADPHEPERVVRTHDPQLQYSDSAAEASPTVRTVAAFHRKAQAKWKVLWASYGRDEAPEPEALEAVLDEILGPHRAALDEADRLEAAQTRRDAAALVQRPLFLVEPSTWWAPGRLDQLLSSVPPDGRVVLVEKL